MRVQRPRLITLLALAGLIAASLAGNTWAQTLLTGNTEGGAFYTIAVPPEWNGDLVVFNHGFGIGDLEEIKPVLYLGVLAQRQLSQGYAVAGSSWSRTGFKAPFHTNDDLRHLSEVFGERVGEPGAVFVAGESFGALVTAKAVEEARMGNVVGGLVTCGGLAAGPTWAQNLDARLLYDVICSNTPAAAIPGGAQGLPAGSSLTLEELVDRVNLCFEANTALFEQLIGTPTASGVFFTVLAWADLIHNGLAGEIPFGNADVVYGDPDDPTDPLHDEIVRVNTEIARVAPHPETAQHLANAVVPTGFVGSTKIVSMHTDKDPVNFVEHAAFYDSLVPAENLTTAVVVENAPTHCEFAMAEQIAAWEALRAWTGVDTGLGIPVGVQPTVAEIGSACESLVERGFEGPCRFDPEFTLEFPGRFRSADVLPPPRLGVGIDVHPLNQEPNFVTARPRWPVLVALLGSRVVDVTAVDLESLAFGPDRAAFAHDWVEMEDVNHDGADDLLVQFHYAETGLPLGESEACLGGRVAGVPFEGCDLVEVGEPYCGLGFELVPLFLLLLLPLLWQRARRRRQAA